MSKLKEFTRSLKNFLNFTDLDNIERSILFYAENKRDWDHLGPLYFELKKYFKEKIYKILSDPNDDFFNDKDTFFIGSGTIRTIFFKTLKSKALILTLPDLENFYLKRSNYKTKYFYIFHSMFSSHRIYNENAFDHYDFIMCAGNYHLNEIRKRENIFKLKEKKLLSFGYPKLDSLIENYKKNNSLEKKKILIAPSWGKSSIIKTSIFKIVDILLDNSFHVILRPHTMSYRYDKKIIKDLEVKYNENENFEIDADLRSFKSFNESFTMISDWSGAAIEFAFSKCYPVIFIDTAPKTNNNNWRKLDLPCFEDTVRDKIGYIVSEKNIESINTIINDINDLEIKKNWQEKILKIRDQSIYNIGHSCSVGTKMILDNI